MRPLLHQAQYLVRLYHGKRSTDLGKVFTWNGSDLITLGHPARYILQTKKDRVLVRDLSESDEVKISIRTFDLKKSSNGERISLSGRSQDAIEIISLNKSKAISEAAIARVGNIELSKDILASAEDLYFKKKIKQFSGSALVMALALFLFKPAEPELAVNEELIPKQYAKLIMTKPKEKMKAPSSGGATQSQAQVKAVARAFQSKTVQKSMRSILQGGLSKYSIMATGKAITALSQKATSSGTAPGVGLENKANTILAGSRVGALQIGSDTGYGSGNGINVKGQGRGQLEIGLNTADASVDEGLTKDEVARVIHSHMNEIRYCYESAILKDPTLAGKILVDFKIGPVGSVIATGVTESSVSDRQVGGCLNGKLRTWKFPNPRGGVVVAVSYPFIFKSLSR